MMLKLQISITMRTSIDRVIVVLARNLFPDIYLENRLCSLEVAHYLRTSRPIFFIDPKQTYTLSNISIYPYNKRITKWVPEPKLVVISPLALKWQVFKVEALIFSSISLHKKRKKINASTYISRLVEISLPTLALEPLTIT